MVNRFTVLPDQKVINTFVEPNYQIMDSALGRMQKMYDDAELLRQQQSDNMKAVETRPIHEDIAYKNQLVSSYEQEAFDIVEKKYGGDYGAAAKELKGLASKYGSNEFWQYNSSAVSKYKEATKLRNEMTKDGKTILGFDESIFDTALRNEDGSYNNVDHRIEGKLEWAKDADELTKGIMASGNGGYKMVRQANGDTLILNSKGEKVTPQEVVRTFRGAFMGSNSYNQMVRMAYHNVDEKTGAQRLEQMMKTLESGLVAKYAYDNTGYTASLVRASSDGKDKDDKNKPTPLESKNSKRAFNTKSIRVDVTADSIRKKAQNIKKNDGGAFGDLGYMVADMVDDVAGTVLGEQTYSFTPEQEAAYKVAQEVFGESHSKNVTPFEKAQLINKYADWLEQQGGEVGYEGIQDEKKRKEETNYYFGTKEKGSLVASHRSFTLTDGEGPEVTNGTELMKEYPLTKYDYTVNGKYGVDNPNYALGRSVAIYDKEGNFVAEYDMSASESELTPDVKLKHSLYKAKFSPTGAAEVMLPTSAGAKKFIMEYRYGTSNELDEKGNPIMTGTDRVRLINAENPKEHTEWVEDGSEYDAEGNPLDATTILYRSLNKNKKK